MAKEKTKKINCKNDCLAAGAGEHNTSRKELCAIALKTFFNIAKLWNLTSDEQRILLGSIPESTFFKWKKELKGILQKDQLERISYILGIFKALQILFPDEKAADAWIKKPNNAPLFSGKSALERMLSGNVSDLFEVRRYLDAQRGCWN